ncbi:hypothetical protein [Petrimonas sulfuriphila]
MKNQQQKKTEKSEYKKISYESPDVQVADIKLETNLFAGSDNPTPSFEIELFHSKLYLNTFKN